MRPIGELIVVDTDVFSYIWKKDSAAGPYLTRLEGATATLSFQTVAELLKGAYKRRFSETTMRDLHSEVSRYYVAPYNIEVADEWAKIMAERDSAGNRIESADCWIAATARWLKAPVMTNNRRHFEQTLGLKVISFAP